VNVRGREKEREIYLLLLVEGGDFVVKMALAGPLIGRITI
jgi:hypothetical protein